MKTRTSKTYIPESLEDCDKLRKERKYPGLKLLYDRCGSCEWARTINFKIPGYHKRYGCFHRQTMTENASWTKCP